jgi:hypothetical protein
VGIWKYVWITVVTNTKAHEQNMWKLSSNICLRKAEVLIKRLQIMSVFWMLHQTDYRPIGCSTLQLLVLILNCGIRLGLFLCCVHRRSNLAPTERNITISNFYLGIRFLILLCEMNESKFEFNELWLLHDVWIM